MEHKHTHHEHESSQAAPFVVPKAPWTDWLPLVVVIAYILGLSVLTAQLTSFTVGNLFSYVMGYFFIVFSLFKMINISGFAMGYHEYDIISKRWYNWGYIAPFVELLLGTLYVLRVDSVLLHIVTIIFSLVIVVGVAQKLAKRELFTCACLGTVLKVPLTKVSLVEYLVMALMAVPMILGVI